MLRLRQTLLTDTMRAPPRVVHVGRHLFECCICGAMASATRVLVTNALHVLPTCDTVSVIHNGTVAESGSYAELVGRGGVLAKMVKTHEASLDEEDEDSSQETSAAEGHGAFSHGHRATVAAV